MRKLILDVLVLVGVVNETINTEVIIIRLAQTIHTIGIANLRHLVVAKNFLLKKSSNISH